MRISVDRTCAAGTPSPTSSEATSSMIWVNLDNASGPKAMRVLSNAMLSSSIEYFC
jgi:hypothetical protein